MDETSIMLGVDIFQISKLKVSNSGFSTKVTCTELNTSQAIKTTIYSTILTK